MEGTPKGLDVKELITKLYEIDSVVEIHDFHVWTISSGNLAMSGHVRATDPTKALKKMNRILKEEFNILHITL